MRVLPCCVVAGLPVSPSDPLSVKEGMTVPSTLRPVGSTQRSPRDLKNPWQTLSCHSPVHCTASVDGNDSPVPLTAAPPSRLKSAGGFILLGLTETQRHPGQSRLGQGDVCLLKVPSESSGAGRKGQIIQSQGRTPPVALCPPHLSTSFSFSILLPLPSFAPPSLPCMRCRPPICPGW